MVPELEVTQVGQLIAGVLPPELTIGDVPVTAVTCADRQSVSAKNPAKNRFIIFDPFMGCR
jgi:hypothetical protein